MIFDYVELMIAADRFLDAPASLAPYTFNFYDRESRWGRKLRFARSVARWVDRGPSRLFLWTTLAFDGQSAVYGERLLLSRPAGRSANRKSQLVYLSRT
jgi:hypothetical protein